MLTQSLHVLAFENVGSQRGPALLKPDSCQGLQRQALFHLFLVLAAASQVLALPGAWVSQAILKISVFLQHLRPGGGMPAISQ